MATRAVEGKARTRKPETRKPLEIIDALERDATWLMNAEIPGPYTLKAMLADLAELRRSLRDTRGEK